MAKFQKVPIIKRIKLDQYENNSLSYRWIHLVSNGIAQPIYVPVIIGKGIKDGPVLGITAVVHGNELNGMSVIQRLFNSIDLEKLSGTIIGIPVVNVPSILTNERRFVDGVDLNRIMPGDKDGNRSKVYANRIVNRIVKNFDYLLDLHTASFGRVNSYYIRADLSSKIAKQLALMQNPQIILNAPPKDGTLRGAAADLGIDAITVEVGDPDKFQKGMIRSSLTGVYNTLSFLKMYDETIDKEDQKAIICKKSYWIYSQIGGIIQVHCDLTQHLKKGDLIATVRDVFGTILKEYFAPEAGIVIGKSTNPIGQTGSRIIHLGIVK
ncbi:succinylglutamate desuccinylase/aspartoacylase family protein [uncultured Tenacibaculum sp.]|uniref:succinylglutamate desuccinylase/aspartoacylase family protein n=1 Tax=uncultured Tenacibaculum sp. TaxID=174713 RepID=UPI00261FB59C|nr:succinylglutamate desuccinylase/aspartoacylase family protein [uncultured Tenacibaculum sp.]